MDPAPFTEDPKRERNTAPGWAEPSRAPGVRSCMVLCRGSGDEGLDGAASPTRCPIRSAVLRGDLRSAEIPGLSERRTARAQLAQLGQ